MDEIKRAKCENCGDLVPEHSIDRYGECRKCKLDDAGMNVGDQKN